jgi:CRP-like cAMP-binding protein
MDKLEILRRSDLFRELNDEQLILAENICCVEVYEPGTIIHRQNSMLDKIYVIEEGLVGIILEPGPLAHRQIQAACNFETFGWEGVIPPHMSTATAKTLEKTRVLAFKGQELIDLCSDNPNMGRVLYQGVARVVADRLHAAYMQCLGVTAQD